MKTLTAVRSRRKPPGELVEIRKLPVTQRELGDIVMLNNEIQRGLDRLAELTSKILEKLQAGAKAECGLHDVAIAVRTHAGRYEEVLMIDHHEIRFPARPPSTFEELEDACDWHLSRQ